MIQGSTVIQMQLARETIASHLTRETTRRFDVAMHGAVLTSAPSMTELRAAVCVCAAVLREAEIGPVQMVLAMKVCAIDSAKRFDPTDKIFPATTVELLLDQIVKWAIIEYYRTVS